jgi:molecular chaperone GrpE (heat shock protein)
MPRCVHERLEYWHFSSFSNPCHILDAITRRVSLRPSTEGEENQAMAQATRVEEGVAQLRTAVRRVDQRFRRLRRQVEHRRRELEKQIEAQRKATWRRARRELMRFRRELGKQPLLKRADALRADATSRFQAGVSGFLDALPIATKRDVERIDRRVAALGRKLRDLEKASGVSHAA